MTSTQIIPVDPHEPDPRIVGQAASILRQGGLVAFPTETVYGLGADALNAHAVRRIFAAKERPAHDPLIVHVAGLGEAERVASHIPELAQTLARRFWPGPLTMVLPKSETAPDEVTAGGPTVAVRCPNHPLALALIRALGSPIAAPSANRFSHTSPTTAQHVWDDLSGRIELILDGGPTAIGIESTVLDLTGALPTVLRPGGVTLEELEAALGVVLVGKPTAGAILASPGLLDRHYAPRSPLYLFTGDDESVRFALVDAAIGALVRGVRIGLLVMNEDLPTLAHFNCPVVALGPQSNLELVAQRLYDAIRILDASGVEMILARDAPSHGLGLAIRDRLRRAAQAVMEAKPRS
jgi:L-threonylcarbamoyladenylate synthase